MLEENNISNEELETSENPDEELDLDLDEDNQDESDESMTEDSSEDVESLKAKLKELEDKNKQLYARVKKTDTKPEAKKSSNNSGLTREEAILFAKGYTEDEVELAVKLAKINEVNPLVAAEDSYFKAKVLERKQKEKSSRASLDASGSTNKFTPKDIGKMSDEEHAKLYYEKMGES
jgi:hypothetical protein